MRKRGPTQWQRIESWNIKSDFVPEADGVSAGLFEPFCGEEAVDLIWSSHVQRYWRESVME